MSASQSNQPKAILSLTGVRGFAAIWVVFYHMRDLFNEAFPDFDILNRAIQTGYLGVDLFAFLSGFIIAYIYGSRLKTPSVKSLRRFMWLRFVRTYPLHIFILGLFIAMYVLQMGVSSLVLLPNDKSLIYQIFLLNGLGIEDKWAWNVPSWSLSAEWACYVIFPILAPFIARVKNGYMAMLMAGLTLIATIMTMTYLGSPDFDSSLKWGLIRIAGEFFTGCWLYRIHKSGLLNRLPMGWIGLLSGLAVIYLLLFTHFVGPVICLFALMILCLAQDKQPLKWLFGNPISLYLGEISYSVYMLHWIVIVYAAPLGLDQLSIGWQILTIFMIIMMGSALTYHFVEQTSRRKLRNYKYGDRATQSLVT